MTCPYPLDDGGQAKELTSHALILDEGARPSNPVAGTRTVLRMTTYCAPCLADLALVREAVTAVSGTASCMAHAVLLTHPGDTAQRRLQRLSELRTSAEGKLATASTQDVPAIEILIQEYALAGAMDMSVPLRELAGDRAPRPPKSRRGRGGRPENGERPEHGGRPERGERPERPERPERAPRPEQSGDATSPESPAPTSEAPVAPTSEAPVAAPTSDAPVASPTSDAPVASPTSDAPVASRATATAPAPEAVTPAAPEPVSVPAGDAGSPADS